MATYRGYKIKHDESGFYTDAPLYAGYCDTLDELKEEIDYSQDGDEEPPQDTPSLDLPWWITER